MIKNWLFLSIFVLSVVIFSTTAFYVSAAQLNYTNDTNIYLSTPAINVVIKANSVADGLTVNAANLAVTLSAGETLTLTSPQSLSSSTTGSGGVLSQTCSSGIETNTITQTSASKTYTLTSTGSACTSSGGGGVSYYTITASAYANGTISPSGSALVSSGSSQTYVITPASGYQVVDVLVDNVSQGAIATYTFTNVTSSHAISATFAIATSTPPTPLTPPTPPTQSAVDPSDPAFVQREIQRLQALIADLMAQLRVMQASQQYVFTKDLKLGTTDPEVKLLQQYLNTHGFALAVSGAGSPGDETTYFGALTQAALIKFQKANNISPAVGYFGPITRSFINWGQ